MKENQEIVPGLANRVPPLASAVAQERKFETEFKSATTITALREFLKQLKMEKIKLMAGASPSPNALAVMDEQLRLVQWELKGLKSMQSKGRFRAYYAFLKLLDEHHPFKTPVIQYKYMLDDGVIDLKKEILSNMLHLPPVERVPYLERIQFETEGLLKNVYATEEVLDEWYSRYNTSEQDVFSPEASRHQNLVYRVLTAKQAVVKEPSDLRPDSIGMAADEVFDGEGEYGMNPEYDIQNDFYNVFYGRAVREVVQFVKEEIERQPPYPPQAELTIAQAPPKTSKSEMEVKEFEELFLAREESEPCFQLLKDSQPPVVDDSNGFCLGQRSKGAVVAWVDVMKDKNKMWKSLSDSTIAAILNNKITGLNITDRTIRSAQTKLSKNYRTFYRQF